MTNKRNFTSECPYLNHCEYLDEICHTHMNNYEMCVFYKRQYRENLKKDSTEKFDGFGFYKK